MTKTLTLFLIVLCFIATAQTSAPQSRVYITHVTVINTDTGEQATDQTVVISDGKIADVAKSESLAVPASARIVDGRDKYLIPGLWDMHVHTWDYESTYPLYIANGVTGVREMFGPPDANKFKAELDKKQLIAPHFYLASPIVDGHPPVWPNSIEVTTPEQGRKVVDDQQQKGADFIKVYSRLAPEAYFAIAAESARVGISFEGHVPNQVSAWKASDAKQKSFEHMYGIAIACSTREGELQAKMLQTTTTKERKLLAAAGAQSYSESKCNHLFTRLKANSNWQVPTLTVFRPKNWIDSQLSRDPRLRYFSGGYRDWLMGKNDSRLKGWTTEDLALERQQFEFDKKLAGAMFRAGVPLLAGTDTGNPYCFPGFSLHDELALLVESGLTPLAALRSATLNAAAVMNASHRYGTIAPGKIADLVLLDANPLQDIHNTTKISEVFLGGKEFDRAALDLILKNAEQEAKASLNDNQSAFSPRSADKTANAPAAVATGSPQSPNLPRPQLTTGTHPLSEPGDPPGLAEFLKRMPRIVERPLITGRQAVVTSLEPLASMAGMRVLQQGGNAFDAAVATAVALTVVDPRMSSVGGNGFATVYVAKTHEVRALNFYGSAPRHATVDIYKGKDYSHGFLSVPVPSCLKGYEALHKEYGRLPWAQVLQPAIELAENGFVLPQELGEFIQIYQEEFAKFPSTARVFLPNGRALKPGDIFRQPDLARTLRGVAEHGTDYFYHGDVATRIATFFQENGGVLTIGDLSNYHAKWLTPISTMYRGYMVYTQPPSSSAVAVLEQLNMLEGYDLKALGHNSPEYLHLLGEVVRLAAADRNRYVGDPDFVRVPVDRLVSKEYAAERRKLIHLDSTMSAATAGDFGKPEETHTTHLNVVDGEGNMVALTQTLGDLFGSRVVAADTGVLLSDEMRHLHLDPNDPSRLEPGKRSRSNESPIIIIKDGKPYMAIGTPGSDGIWQHLVQVIANVIDFGMDIQTAITVPRMRSGGVEAGTAIKPTFVIEDRIPAATMDALRAKGYEVRPISRSGAVNGIVIDPATGFRLGGADPREDGYALGW